MWGAVRWWTVPPQREVSYLIGVEAELLSISLDPLPSDAPAVVEFRPISSNIFDDQVEVLLDELSRAAVALFPSWLPGAERLDGPNRLGVEAVRALAGQFAARSNNFGPFLADLAERSLRARATPSFDRGIDRRLPAEVRAAGLARVVAAAYGRDLLAVLLHVPEGLAPANQRALTAAAEWLADYGRLSVWLVGGPLENVDRLRCIAVTLSDDLANLSKEEASRGTDAARSVEPRASVLTIPPLSGVPRSDSEAERALEKALGRHRWAEGRHWNYTYQSDVLSKPYRLDLFWPVECLVVEVDGPDHLGRLKYADDRRRDVRLQLLGYDVLRFTNEQVLSEVDTVVLEIKQLLDRRRGDATNPPR